MKRFFLLPLCTLIVSCSSKADDPAATPPTTTAGALPCEVQDVLAANCQSCHGSLVRNAAPMSLVTIADFNKPAPSDPTKTVGDLVRTRIADATRPMPAAGLLAPADRAKLDGWIVGGKPKAPVDQKTCVGAPEVPPVTDTLPCPPGERTSFVAHAEAATSKYDVPVDAGNSYMCFTWKSPWTKPTQATGFAPIIDDARVLHHWILYETSTPQPEGGVAKCKMPADAAFIQGWAPGATGKTFDSDMGMKLPGSDKYLILQIHYWNVARHADSRDASGVSMCTTNTLRPKEIAVSRLGSASIKIPAKTESWSTTGNCTPEITEPVHIVSSAPHMHQRGTSFKTEILRADGKIETLVDLPRWDFEAQSSYPADTILQKGDRLRTTCTYQNPTDKTIYFGERTEDEMCFNFISTWPSTGIVNSVGKSVRACMDR